MKKLSHQHLVRLVGAYTHAGWLGMLLEPVAICDLRMFFEDAEAYWKSKADHDQTRRLQQLGYLCKSPPKHMAGPVYGRIGCLISAVSYLHSHKVQIRHKDLKPSNILLSRDNIYLSDFGCATDFSTLSRSATDGGGGTTRYYSPEVSVQPGKLLQNVTDILLHNREPLTSLQDGHQTYSHLAACSLRSWSLIKRRAYSA